MPRKRKIPSRFEVGDGEGYHSPTAKDHYRCCYFEAFDLVVLGIKQCFDQSGNVVYSNLEQLLLEAIKSNWIISLSSTEVILTK